MTDTERTAKAVPMLLRRMPLPDVATLHGIVVRMMDLAASVPHERSFSSVVDRMDGMAKVVWKRDSAILTAHHDVRCFVGLDDLHALHLTLVEGRKTSVIVEPRRIDRSNEVGKAENPTTALISTLTDLRSSLTAASPEPGDWSRPKLQSDHMHETSLGEAFARSIPDHVNATITLSGQDTAMFVNIVMPSPYSRARYDGAEPFARNPKAVKNAAAKASSLLPECIMASRIDNDVQGHGEWEISPYRTGFEMVEAKGDPMERLRILAHLEGEAR